MHPYQDPVQQFEAQQRQAMATGGIGWAVEQDIRKRLNREPRYAVAWSWYFPGGGMFFLGKPFIGLLQAALAVFVFVIVCVKWRMFGGVIGTIVCLFVFQFLLTIAFCIHAYITARQLRQQAVRDLEEYENRKRQAQMPPQTASPVPPPQAVLIGPPQPTFAPPTQQPGQPFCG